MGAHSCLRVLSSLRLVSENYESVSSRLSYSRKPGSLLFAHAPALLRTIRVYPCLSCAPFTPPAALPRIFLSWTPGPPGALSPSRRPTLIGLTVAIVFTLRAFMPRRAQFAQFLSASAPSLGRGRAHAGDGRAEPLGERHLRAGVLRALRLGRRGPADGKLPIHLPWTKAEPSTPGLALALAGGHLHDFDVEKTTDYILPTSSSGSAPPEYMHDIELGAYSHAQHPPSPSPSSSSAGSTPRSRPFIADTFLPARPSPAPRTVRPST
ncbi:hypothetical protein FB451DRAFT_1564891 [Mycena latifolia]|nr:hypothetical protein FB451DRAFT_1564891 [Mycena latifolia]